MTVNLNPAIPAELPSQPAQPGEEADDAAGNTAAGGKSGPADARAAGAAAATTGERLVAATSALEALLSNNLQGTAAVDAPELMQQAAVAREGAARSTSAEAQSQRAGALQNLDASGAATLDNSLTAPTAGARTGADPAQRGDATAATLTLPPAVAAGAGLINDTAAAALPMQPSLVAGTVNSLAGGQTERARLAADHDEPRNVQRRSPRDRRQRDDEPELFDDDLPEQHMRSREEARQAHDHDHNHEHDERSESGDARPWPAVLARRLARECNRDPGGACASAVALAQAQWDRGRAVLVVCPERDPNAETGQAMLVWRTSGPRTGQGATSRSQTYTISTLHPASMFGSMSDGMASGASGVGAAASAGAPRGMPGDVYGAARVGVPDLHGQRFAARLHWRAHDNAGSRSARVRWWAVRTVKHHGSSMGRQLRTTTAADPRSDGDAFFDDTLLEQGLALQLGPVLLPHAREWDLRVRIDAVQRLWSALQDQWSLVVVACSDPLVLALPAAARH